VVSEMIEISFEQAVNMMVIIIGTFIGIIIQAYIVQAYYDRRKSEEVNFNISELSSDQYQKMFKKLGFDKYSVIREAKLNLITVDESMDKITKMCNWAYVEGKKEEFKEV
jgi:adenylate cyclase class IV